MAFTFRIYISGLFVLVPDDATAPKHCDVLLVNLLLPRKLQRLRVNSQENEILDPHFPMLIFGDPVPSKRAADFKPLAGDHKGRNVYLLLHDDLEVLPDGKLTPDQELIDVSSPGEQSFSHIAKMADVSPAHERIDPTLLTKELKPELPVVSRIRGLTGGKLYTADLSKDKVKIDPPGNFAERRIALRLAWQIRCETHMILRWRRFDIASQVTSAPIDLKWEEKPNNSDVEIWIENREIDTLIGVPNSYPVSRALADFEVYYGLQATAPAFDTPPPVPIPIPMSGLGMGPQAGSLHGGLCPGTLMLR